MPVLIKHVLIKHALTVSMLSLLFALAACAAPSSPSPSPSAQVDLNKPAPAPEQRTTPKVGTPIKMPPLGGPLPPERVPEPAGKPVQVDRSCKVDSDCVVKNVGNCCGYYPACVHKASPTDPAGVQAQCAKDGMASVCGFAEIDSCRCVQGQCIAGVAAIDPSQDPPAVDPVR